MLAVCTLSHENTNPERGFSTNKHILSVYGTSTDQKTIEALCLVQVYIDLQSKLGNNLERKNKNLKLSKELLKEGERELKSLMKAGKVDKKKLLSGSAKTSTSLKLCGELQSEKYQLSEKRMKLSELLPKVHVHT